MDVRVEKMIGNGVKRAFTLQNRVDMVRTAPERGTATFSYGSA